MLNARTLASRLVRLARSAGRSQGGGVAMTLALMTMVLIGCVGIAIDTGRAMIVKAKLVSALDAAGLAVGARVTTTDYTADAKRFVNANFKADYAGATVLQDTISASLNSDKSVVTLAATATMPTIFMKMFGTPLVTVKATSEITRAVTGLELVMVLDNTGSMQESLSMPALKTGAKQLVTDLMSTNPKDVYIGLVPFSQAVNIGTDALRAANWTDLSIVARPYYPALWTGCVEARGSGLDQTDDPPVVTDPAKRFKVYYSPDSSGNNWIRTWGPSVAYVDYKNQRGPGAYCPTAMTPMTNDKSRITAGIDAMTAQGSTFINLGAIWGWRMLSPRWRGKWGGDMAANNLPLDYNTPKMAKAVVLMTDGENSFGENNYTAYGDLSERRLGPSITNTPQANAELDARLTKACSSMKANGITVITIAYDNPKPDTKALLETCASNTSLYFDSKNTTQLIADFGKITSALSQLRVSR